ncbi:MAG: RNA polymerase sigma factor [Bacteroidota bacterium]
MNPTQQVQFEALLKEHQDRIYRICRAYLYDQSLVEDLYQDVLLKLWQQMARFRGESQWTTWMYRIAVNTAITYNRRRKKDRQVFASQEMGVLPEPISEGSTDAWEKERLLQQLHHSIQQLPEGDRLLVSLQLEGMSYQQISDIMGLTVNHVGVKLNRIKKKLSKLMQETYES